MKTASYFFVLLFLWCIASPALAQTHTPRYISMMSKTKGYYEYLPEGYDSTGTATYPLILFMTGIGEFGNGSATQLPNVNKNGLTKLIEAGSFPKSFTVGGQVFRFIVITPQFIKFPRPEAADMDMVLDYIIAHYKVDINRIYITGLSYGGGLCWAYSGANDRYCQRVAAIVPIATPIPDGGDSTIYARSRVIATHNVAVWATHNLRDPTDTVATTITYVNDINLPPAPTPLAKKTLFNASGHDAWTKTYSPTFKENGLNVYEWMLQYQRKNTLPNQVPTASAGADQSITLPANTVSLNGTGTDNDGSITTYSWIKVSGPASGTITSVNKPSTTVTGLVQGTYVFRLTVTDNNGASAMDDVAVVVNEAPNEAPQANAGTDQAITLPANNITLSGAGTDSDGVITTYSWTKVSGPEAGGITTPGAASTPVTDLVQGTYVFRLTVTDNKGATATDDVNVTVNAAPNKAPQANAGADQIITLPTNSITLSGSGTDADGSISTFSWIKVSGPDAGSIAAPGAVTTTVTGLVQGTYVFRLTVTDNKGAVASDNVTITVNAAPNEAPQANAGSDQTITLPIVSVTLNGSGVDSDGTIAAYSWVKVSGPSAGNIVTPSAATTKVNGLVIGVYVFRLTITDNKGAAATDDVTVTVNAAPNVAPQSNAGLDQTITLPTNQVTLSGSGTDSDGTITTFTWMKVSGPDGGFITAPNMAATNVTDLVQGTYVFRLTVTDNKGAAATDDVTVVVNAAPNVIPQADAGTDQTITLPVNEVTLTGSGTDSDGTIRSYAWKKVSGPAGEIITNPAAATTTVTALQQGVYIFRLTVTDNKGGTASDDVNITVDAGATENKAPVANAGADQTLTLPENNVTLTGTGTDSDGSITQYTWTKISGPDGSSITTPDKATTTITGLTEGTYTFRLKVTDNAGSIAFDDVSIIVNAAPNKPPVASAGTDITITLPVNTITLSGTGSDTDGTIAYYEWTKVSGPSEGTITDSYTAATTITGLVQGSYTFRLTVTDNKGATASDDVIVTVNPAPNMAPQVYAGDDQTIVLPANSVSLSGDAIDADGTIASYSWTKVSGPDGSSIAVPGSSTTQVSDLVEGIYVFRLTVIDNNGATAFDDVIVTVQTAPNQAPQADAGADQQITLPVNSITLHGFGTDSDGTIISYDWIKISGPAGGTLSTPTADSTLVTDLQQGTYVFQLTVTDNNGAVATDQVTIEARVVTGINDDPTRAGYKLLIAPNPTATYFSIKLLSPSARPAYVRVTDALGRVVEERTNVQRNSAITIGQQYRPGVYHVEVIQDGKRIVAQLLKL